MDKLEDRTKSLLAIDDKIQNEIPAADRHLEMKSTVAAKAGAHRKHGSKINNTDPRMEEHMAALEESISNNTQWIYDDFRDKAWGVYEGSLEYINGCYAPLLDRCDFGKFMMFCEEITQIKPVTTATTSVNLMMHPNWTEEATDDSEMMFS